MVSLVQEFTRPGTPTKEKTVSPVFVRGEDERPKISYNDFSQDIPIISLANLNSSIHRAAISEQLTQAFEEWGIFQAVDHGIDPALMAQMTALTRAFFSLPLHEKQRFSISQGKPGGFVVSSHVHEDEAVMDWRELMIYITYPVQARDYSQWPEKPEGWREVVDEYSARLRELGCKIVEVLSHGLGLDREVMVHACGRVDQRLVLNYYPECPQPDMTLGLRRHTDPGIVTLLLQDQVGGLQATKDGGKTWITVLPVEGALVVNLGDHAHFLSNGKFKNADHQVVVNSEQSRISIATFHNPAPEAMVYPLKLEEGEKAILDEPITFKDMYRNKMGRDL
ncbi:naringenin,2-oxoglutarate 3-dioxygenase [Amborella trichopoda]|uniref:naringenin,2-oxoglutarate 3-dioxygenase n=1 Tax=Amborella trichopoda TaxID=13333 RepID=UPI0005D3AA64|nr:naringenin,2-oxoglutarate 3-dioxygenase [Amborella trichopoda]|eukprot:XP_011626120.1 naringenin,2-oxoglutarate 3-dioxygenase [Amborella trichopoda]